MPSINIQFSNPINTSVQVGDTIYSINVSNAGTAVNTFRTADLQTALEIGYIWQITNRDGLTAGTPISIDVMQTGAQVPNANSFIMFSKSKAVNTSGIKGYYAEVTFENHTTFKDVELFSVAAGIAASSS